MYSQFMIHGQKNIKSLHFCFQVRNSACLAFSCHKHMKQQKYLRLNLIKTIPLCLLPFSWDYNLLR